MTIKNHVTSFGLSKRLKELGVDRKSLFYYCASKDPHNKIICETDVLEDDWFVLYAKDEFFTFCDWSLSAFLASELSEMLPSHLYVRGEFKTNLIIFDKYTCEYRNLVGSPPNKKINMLVRLFHSPQEANCRAEMLIYLLEKNIINLEDLK